MEKHRMHVKYSNRESGLARNQVVVKVVVGAVLAFGKLGAF
jgi:hypothetical protein